MLLKKEKEEKEGDKKMKTPDLKNRKECEKYMEDSGDIGLATMITGILITLIGLVTGYDKAAMTGVLITILSTIILDRHNYYCTQYHNKQRWKR